jgi:hypothetical protein
MCKLVKMVIDYLIYTVNVEDSSAGRVTGGGSIPDKTRFSSSLWRPVPRYLSRYSDELRTGRLRSRS